MTTDTPSPTRRLAAFWFADIAGFTTLSGRDERAAIDAVDALRAAARAEVERASGRLVKVSGDAVLAEFGSSEAALRSAIALRAALADRVPLHFGVHLGEVTENHGDIYGDGVNTAARLQSRALTGQIVVSEDIYRHMKAYSGFSFQPLGEFELKGLDAPVRAYCVELAQSGAATSAGVSSPKSGGTTRTGTTAAATSTGTRPATRLIVTPFRMLRPDTDTDFLSFSLADAVSFSLASLESLVVRSSHMAGAAPGAADPRDVARRADVDMVVSGTLLRVGDRLQVTAELTDGSDGTRLGSFRTQAGLGDLFELQDDVANRIVSSLALPLSAREKQRMSRDVPATARAYELYLRANQYLHRMGEWATPRDLYLAALEEDPSYAPAWARLGRCYRLIGKYGPADQRERQYAEARAALDKALALNPDLDLAHNVAAHLETEIGRCGDAMVRLLTRLETRPRGVDLLGGLVLSLRYCGLLDESLAAHRAAVAIDPSASTSVTFTHLLRGEYEESFATGVSELDFYAHALAHFVLGQPEEAKRLLHSMANRVTGAVRQYVEPYFLYADGQIEQAVALGVRAYTDFPDAEGRYFVARLVAHVGRTEEALAFLSSAVPEYAALPDPGADPWLASVDRSEAYGRLLGDVRERREQFRSRFNEIRRGRRF